MADGESGAGRGRPASVRRSPSQLAQQRAQRGVGSVAPRGVHDRLGGCHRGGGFGTLASGVSIQGAPALLGRRGGGVLPAPMAPMALDRFVAFVLEPFAEAEDLEQGFGYAANGRLAPIVAVLGLLGAGVDVDQPRLA